MKRLSPQEVKEVWIKVFTPHVTCPFYHDGYVCWVSVSIRDDIECSQCPNRVKKA